MRYATQYHAALDQGQLWTPALLNGRGLVGWYEWHRDGAITWSGSTITGLADLSVAGSDLTDNSSAPSAETLAGRRAMDCNGSVYLRSTGLHDALEASDDLVIVLVMHAPLPSFDRGILGGSSTADSFGWRYDVDAFGTPTEEKCFRGSVTDGTLSYSFGQTLNWPTDPCIAVYSFKSGEDIRFYVDGNDEFSTGWGGPTTGNLVIDTEIRLGYGPKGYADDAWHFGDMLILNVHPGQYMLRKIEGYIAWNYFGSGDRTLVNALARAGHRYGNAPPMVGGL